MFLKLKINILTSYILIIEYIEDVIINIQFLK